MNNIYLIGMPGCGKSTIGKMVSQKLKLKNVDADEYLENKYCRTIPQIFDLYGEEDFRQKESEVIRELSNMSGLIVSTGGGVVVKVKNKNVMKNSGTVVFIHTLPENILKNSNLSGRPLLKDKNRIFDLYEQRISLYRDFADIIIDNNGDIETTVNEILKHIKEWAKWEITTRKKLRLCHMSR